MSEEKSTDVTQWADEAMFKAEEMESTHPKVYLLSATPDPLGAIASACMIYEGRVVRDLAEITDDQRRHYWGEVQKTHLKAPLEFVDLHFMIEGVTRAFTHQMVRQRTAVYAQESLRFAVKEDLDVEVQVPPSLDVHVEEDQMHISQEERARRLWDDTMGVVGKAYNTLINMGVPAEDARGLMPHAVTTRLHYKTNLRNLLDHAGNRLCTQAQFEWREAFASLLQSLRGQGVSYRRSANGMQMTDGDSDWQWDLMLETNVFRPVCYELGHCPFTADFDRGCTIRERVQKGEFEKIDPREWLADPAAARKGG